VPSFVRCWDGPMPDRKRMAGLPNVPAARMTSAAERISPSTSFTPTARWPSIRTLSTSASPRIARLGRAAAHSPRAGRRGVNGLLLPRLRSVVALQIRDDGLGRGFGDRCAKRADHLVHQVVPRGTRERGLHRDVRRAVTDTAEALHEG